MEDKSYIKKLRKILNGKPNYQKFRYIINSVCVSITETSSQSKEPIKNK